MDRLLARRGDDPAGGWLITCGRARQRRTTRETIGFGGRVAYWESIDNRRTRTRSRSADLEEVAEQRLQTPEPLEQPLRRPTAGAPRYEVHHDENVAVTNLAITNTGRPRRRAADGHSPYAKTADGHELTGIVDALNDLTTIFPRLCGDDVAPTASPLAGIAHRARRAAPQTTKVQMGFVTEEIDARATSTTRSGADARRRLRRPRAGVQPVVGRQHPLHRRPGRQHRQDALLPLVADALQLPGRRHPGQRLPVPTSMEGVLGYNNAIALTVAMFIDDLKYLRPDLLVRPWVSTGRSRGARYVDNPATRRTGPTGTPSTSPRPAWRTYQLHGGPAAIARTSPRTPSTTSRACSTPTTTTATASSSTTGARMTGNDADAVSFDWRDG